MKRTDVAIAQARLAVEVARAFIRQEVATRDERTGLKLLERVADIAGDIGAVRVFLLYGIDPLKAVPLEDFRTTAALHKVRWPQIVAEVGEKRNRCESSHPSQPGPQSRRADRTAGAARLA